MDDETMLRLEAIQKFILKSTVPISEEEIDGQPVAIGTGTLLRINDRYFLIAAQHLFDDPETLKRLAIPNAVDGDGYTRLLNLVYTRPTVEEIDIAIIEITSSDSVAAIKESWNFLTLDNVDVTTAAMNVWVVGYPSALVRANGANLVIEPFTLLTERLLQVPMVAKPPIHEGLDIFYAYARSADVLGKGIKETPNLKGLSGAAIWDVSRNTGPGLWVPERFAKMVAIQSSAMHSDYLRTKSWWAVARSLSKIDDELAKEVFEKTGVTPDNTPPNIGDE